jgi:hypothetical protein
MKAQAIFLDCPAYLDKDGATRCGLPAEVEARYTIGSTGGPLDSAKIRCPRGHWFNGPIESVTVPQQRGVAAASASMLPPLTMPSRGIQVAGPRRARRS